MVAPEGSESWNSFKPCSDCAQDGNSTWVFAYGSLMWRPGFEPQEIRPARLFGHHRAMCILSNVYRGTEAIPGLVLGLDRGGSCLGQALRVRADQWGAVKQMLDDRELVTGTYRPLWLSARLENGAQLPVYAYVAERSHHQYWSGPQDEAIRLIRQGWGKSGSSRDYLAETVAHLSALGIRGSALQRLLHLVDGKAVIGDDASSVAS